MTPMRETLNFLKEKIVVISVFFFLYVVVYAISKQFGLANAIKTAGGIVYLPAGVRLLACLVGRVWGAVGIALGSWLIVTPDVFKDQSDIFYFTLAMINTFSVFFAVLLAQRIFKISEDLSNLKFIQLPFIDLFATFSQACIYYYFLRSVGLVSESELLPKFISQVTGNFLGGMIFMFGLILFLNLTKSPHEIK